MANGSHLSGFFSLSLPNHDLFPLQTNYSHRIFSEDETLTLNQLNPNGTIFKAQLLLPSQDHYFVQQPFQIKNSKYSKPCKEFLSEICDLSGDMEKEREKQIKGEKMEEMISAISWNDRFLASMNPSDLHKRRARLFFLLQEVNKKYRRYYEQMRAIISSFESMSGKGAAEIYTKLELKATSRNFRHLKDSIVAQLHVVDQKLLMKNDIQMNTGSTGGETPRLKLLEQKMRQERIFHNGGLLDSNPWRPQRGLPEKSVSILRAWLFEHFLNPYPTNIDKHILAQQTGLSRSQVSNWFINARVRLWKPMIEEIYNEETNHQNHNPNLNPNVSPNVDQKPVQGQFINQFNSLISPIGNGRVSLTLGLQKDDEPRSSSFTAHIEQGKQGQFAMLEEVEFNGEFLHDLAR